jgi:hypothetical protein
VSEYELHKEKGYRITVQYFTQLFHNFPASPTVTRVLLILYITLYKCTLTLSLIMSYIY